MGAQGRGAVRLLLDQGGGRGTRTDVSERATGTKLADLKQIALGLTVLGSLFALVYAPGPIGAVGAVLAPLIFWLSLKWLD
ncbi:MAG: hypothetical protein H0U17_02015 [Actinobacteria bacterium]|nr:hypothetical protein [Actinomycetota bacterium]